MRVLRVATFNAHHGAGLDDDVDLSRTAAAIVATDADLVGLQEIDRNNPRSGDVDQAALLQELTGLHVYFNATVQGRGAREYGIALACRDRLEVRFDPLPRLGDEEPRGLQATRWMDLTVINTHLSTDRRARARQTQVLAARAAELEAPVVLLGDLNQGRPGLRALRRAGLKPASKRHHTLSTRALRWEIDFVLAGRGAEVVHSETLTTDASDHVPVVAEIAIH